MDNEDYIITKVGWITNVERDYEFNKSVVYDYFYNLLIFLDDNNLTTNTIRKEKVQIDDDTLIKKSDLNDDGFELMKKAYGKWADGIIDKGKLPEDVKYLEKALKKIKGW